MNLDPLPPGIFKKKIKRDHSPKCESKTRKLLEEKKGNLHNLG